MAESVCKPICDEHFLSRKAAGTYLWSAVVLTITLVTSCVAWAMTVNSSMAVHTSVLDQQSKDIAELKAQYKSIDSKLDIIVVTTTHSQDLLKGRKSVTP